MSEMIERVAAAIHGVYLECQRPEIGFSMWPEKCAKAAIEAMCEPTDEMIAAADDWCENMCIAEYNNKDVWSEMIDAALGKAK